MFSSSFAFVKRFAILIPGVIIAYLSVRDIFPYFDHRLPIGIAILATYVLGAYLLVPAIIRVVRAIKPTHHLPLYCVTPDGLASDPLNIGIVGTRRELIKSMEKAGWCMSDPKTAGNMFRLLTSLLLRRSYASAPVSSLYLFGRTQDIAFSIPIEGSFSGRHHVRFWATTYKNNQKISTRSIHWHKRRAHVQADNLLWVGAASLDVGITFIRHTLQVTHMVDPDTNQERDFVLHTLHAKQLVASIESIRLGGAYELMNRVWRGRMHSDGKMSVIRLKT
jgi:hypothetical protein